MAEAVRIATDAGCHKVTLTTNKPRHESHQFYESIGFQSTHLAYRLDLKGEGEARQTNRSASGSWQTRITAKLTAATC
jgi:hypothetical protein